MTDTEMTNRTATAAEVRKHYKDAGYEVRIDGNYGHVMFRNAESNNDPWLDGRYVSEYRVDDEGYVYLT